MIFCIHLVITVHKMELVEYSLSGLPETRQYELTMGDNYQALRDGLTEQILAYLKEYPGLTDDKELIEDMKHRDHH